MYKEEIISTSLLDIINRIYEIRPFIYHIKLQKLKGLCCAEIGVRDGKNAEIMIKNLNIEKIYLIDPYEEYEEFMVQHKVERNFDFNNAEEDAKNRLNNYKAKTQWIKKKSEEAIDDIKEKLDFVYIDGNHAYDFVKKDIELYWNKIKMGGYIGGHDFDNQFGVMRAVSDFAEKNNLKLNFYKCDWWIKK